VSEWKDMRQLGLLRYLYLHFIYRYHMQMIHRRGWHWWTYLHPIDGEPMDWCQWCGQKKIWLRNP